MEGLDSVEFNNVLDELRVFQTGVLKNVFPVFQISYTRSRYVVPDTDIRLCIDSDIHVRKVNKSLVKKNFKNKYLSQCVFELKGETARLPKRLAHLEHLGFQKNSFSKYERCYRELIE